MPATTVTQADIWNLALARLGAKRVASAAEILAPTRTETKAITAVWDMALELVLRAFPWPWAMKRLELVDAVDATWAEWSYRYVYPADCCNFLYVDIGNRDKVDKVPFRIIAKNDLSAATILTDQQDAFGVYTALVTDVTVWDATFIAAISWLIAGEIGFALNRPRTVRADLLELYQQVINSAWATIRDEEEFDKLRDTPSVRARG